MMWPVSGRAVGSESAAEDRMRNARAMAGRRRARVAVFGQKGREDEEDRGGTGLIKEERHKGPTTCIAEIPAVSRGSHVGCINH